MMWFPREIESWSVLPRQDLPVIFPEPSSTLEVLVVVQSGCLLVGFCTSCQSLSRRPSCEQRYINRRNKTSIKRPLGRGPIYPSDRATVIVSISKEVLAIGTAIFLTRYRFLPSFSRTFVFFRSVFERHSMDGWCLEKLS